MKISLNWLRELVDLPADADTTAVANALTLQGLEVETIEMRCQDLRGVLVAEVLGMRPHPNAEKLRIVRVRAGDREEDVVCGAPNVPPPGNRVCWAPPGARLPSGTLDQREIRGVSSPGMLCGESELGIGPHADGILILSPTDPHGADLVSHFGLRDDILDVNVTPNRPDALSHMGIARELAAFFGTALCPPVIDDVPQVAQGPAIDVQVADRTACPRYLARFVTNVTVGPSPLAMRQRLASCGIRAISNLVDVTNYVLLETGHPLHAFDLDKLSGGIVVRRAGAGESMVTLDGQERALSVEDIVIADARGPVALAGVMGGASSEVSAQTRQVLLEAATFEGRSIRRTAKRLGLHSEASYRYERGVDPNGIPFAAARAAALLAKVGGGALLLTVVDRYPQVVKPRKVPLSARKLQRLTGAAYDADFARGKLQRLGFSCESTPDGLLATVPTYRPDISIEEDLVEEVLRMGEYATPVDRGRILSNANPLPNPEGPADRARSLLAAAGLHEVATWAFVPRAALTAIAGDRPDAVLSDGMLVKNPISADYEVMRTSLLPGLADALRRNLARGAGQGALPLFEVGPVVRRPQPGDNAPTEPTYAAGILGGAQPGWLKPGEALDFFDAKHVVGQLLRGFGVDAPTYRAPGAAPFLHPGVSAEILLSDGAAIGRVGELHPVVARRLGLDVKAFYFELRLGALVGTRPALRTVAPARFPPVTRDVSFWIDAGIPAADQQAALLSARESLLRDVAVREDFRDPRYAPAGRKGMLWSLTYRADDRTLTDGEVDAAHARVVAALSQAHSIQIR